MTERHFLIIGGGIAGLSAGCFALRSDFRTTIVEHNLALGDVCTAGRGASDGPVTVIVLGVAEFGG
jgi:glycine/D-amino acid oxidase-like deaminating enzyme